MAAGGVRHPRLKQLKVAKAAPLRPQQRGVAPKETRTTGAQSSSAPAKPDACKGKPAQGQPTSLVRVQVPQKMGIVSKLGTTAPISFSKRRSANAPSVTTLLDRPPPPPSPAPIKPKGQLMEKRRKISTASSHFSEAASLKTEGISHTTLQDMHVSRMKEQLEGNTALPSSSPSLEQQGRHESDQTGADVLSAVSSATLSMASLDNTSVGGPKARGTSTPLKGASLSQSTIGCAAEAQEHCSARATSSTSLTSFASSSKLPRLSATSSGLASHSSVTHSRVTSARDSIQGDSQLQSNSLKLEVDLSHLQMIGPEQNESRPFSAASGSLPGAELEGSGSGRHFLDTPTQAGADMQFSSEFGVEEDQASRKDAEEFEGSLKRIHYGDSVTSHGSASTQSTSVASSTFALPMMNWEKKQSGIAELSLRNYEDGLTTVTDANYLPGDSDTGLLKQFFMSDVEDTQALSKLPHSMMEGSVGYQSPSDAFTPHLHCVEPGGESLQTWNYPIVLPRPSSKPDSSSATTSEVYPRNAARSHSSTSSDATATSLASGSARVANSSRASPVSLHSSGTGQLLAALLSPTAPYSAFPGPGHSHTLSSELAQLSSAQSGSMSMPSSIVELNRCPSSTHSASQVQELLSALTPASPVLLGESRMPSYQEADLTNPPQGPVCSAQASSCSLTANSAVSCGSCLSSGGLQVGPYITARGHHKEDSAGSNASLGTVDPSQATDLPTQDISVREQVGDEVSGAPDVNNLPSPSLHDPVELVLHALSIQPGGSVDDDLEPILIGSQTPMGCPQESENSSQSTLVRSEGASSPSEVPSLGRRADQDKRPTPLPPTTLQPEEADSPRKESDGGGSLTPDGKQVGAECGEGHSQGTSSQGTPFTESHSVTCTGSSVTVGECTAGRSHFEQESELLYTELRREGVGRTADMKAKGQTASSASGGYLTTSDILERNKAYSKCSLAVSDARHSYTLCLALCLSFIFPLSHSVQLLFSPFLLCLSSPLSSVLHSPFPSLPLSLPPSILCSSSLPSSPLLLPSPTLPYSSLPPFHLLPSYTLPPIFPFFYPLPSHHTLHRSTSFAPKDLSPSPTS